MYDIGIIGGGVVGTAIARGLSRYKLNIALFEKEEELAFGVSKSNSGIIHPGTQNSPTSLKGKLCLAGNRLIRKISKELGVDYKEVGELIVAFNQDELAKLNKLKRQAEILGVRGLKIVSPGWLKDNEPNLNSQAIAALYAPTAGIISPYRLAYDLAESALSNGVEFYTSTKVESIIKHGKDYFEVGTNKGVYKTKFLINAAGLFSDEVANLLGINDFSIKPRKGQEFILDKKKEYLANHLIFPLPTKISKGILIIKTSDGNPMIGPTAETARDKYDLSTSDQGLAKVFDSARRLIPSIKEEDTIAYFSGLRPVAGDDFIIRHEDKVGGLITVAGIQSPGLTAAPAIAILVCNLLKKNGLSLKKKLKFTSTRKKTTNLFALKPDQAKKLIKKEIGYGDIVCRCELVSAKEIRDSIRRGGRTMDGIKFRTRAGAGRCHGGFCTTRIMKILAKDLDKPLLEITKKGPGSEIIKGIRNND
tara:strand:+ start:324 stop:1754 length:1431 start_codon:yes stop_codon:yes gene_type:complete